jgi:hypothetical protein
MAAEFISFCLTSLALFFKSGKLNGSIWLLVNSLIGIYNFFIIVLCFADLQLSFGEQDLHITETEFATLSARPPILVLPL